VKNDFPIIDNDQIEAAITSKTKAIIPVHLNGRSADMRQLNDIANKYELKIIEDAAQAFGSTNEDGFLGTQSFAGCFSLSVAKLIATGQGGFVVTNNNKTYDNLNLMRTHGVSDLINSTFSNFGFNFRFNDILASIGIEQLLKLDEHIEKAKQIYKIYRDGLKELDSIKLINAEIEHGQVPTYIEVLVEKRDELINYLYENGIQSRPFYPNLDSSTYLKSDNSFPNSEKFCINGLFLPSGPGQSIGNINKVIDAIHKFERSS
jgi:dTDP-4-amino-4,6-dideoxygalactose transaminase